MTRRRAAWLLLVAVVALAVAAGAQPPAPAAGQRPMLRAGYLRREATGHPGERLLEAFRRELQADDEFRAALANSGYDPDAGLGLVPCDGADDMVRRLNAREFDLAFTPAAIHARQTGDYRPVLKARRPGDLFSPGGVVRRIGVVIVSARHPLFSAPDPPPADAVRAALAAQPLAVAGSQSVAGFHAPLVELARLYNIGAPAGGYAWFENSAEVVKAVLAGLADAGACEEAAIDAVLAEAGLLDPAAPAAERDAARARYVRVLLRTSPVITDPVVMRPQLAGRSSPVGSLLRLRLREFSLGGGFEGLQYLPAEESEFIGLGELLRTFDRIVGEVAP
jgi:hypothetical protein